MVDMCSNDRQHPMSIFELAYLLPSIPQCSSLLSVLYGVGFAGQATKASSSHTTGSSFVFGLCRISNVDCFDTFDPALNRPQYTRDLSSNLSIKLLRSAE